MKPVRPTSHPRAVALFRERPAGSPRNVFRAPVVSTERALDCVRVQLGGDLPVTAEVLMVEDTMTTGRSTLEAVEAVRMHGADIVGVLTLVNRSDNATGFYEAQGLPLISLYTGAELVEAAKSAS